MSRLPRYTWASALLVLVIVGCQEPHNIRMRFAALVPGSPALLAGVDAKNRVLLCDPQTQAEARVLGSHDAAVHELRVSPDGVHIATVADDGRCRVWDVASGRAVAVVSLAGKGTDRGAAAFSADGRLLACGGTGFVEVYALPAGTILRRIPDPQQEVLYEGSEFIRLKEILGKARILSLDLKPDGHRLLVGTDQGVFEVDYLHCAMTWRFERASEPATLVRYAPNGDDFIVHNASGRLDYFSGYKPGKAIDVGEQTLGHRRQPISAAQFIRDGSCLAVLGTDGQFGIIRLSDQRTLMRAAPGKLDEHGLAISADGRSAWVGSLGNVERFTQLALPAEMWVSLADLE